MTARTSPARKRLLNTARRSRRRAARRAAETRALYAYEARAFRDPQLLQSRPIQELRRLATRVWIAHQSARRERPPEIVAGAGYFQSGRYLSFCEGRRRIVLARHERNRLVLLHELTHALNFATHGAGFRKKYFEIVRSHGGRLSARTRRALAVDPRSLEALPTS